MTSKTILSTLLVQMLFSSCDLYEDIFENKEAKTGSVSDADGHVYPTVTIGSQVWMAENLKITKYRDSSAIYCTTCPNIWASLTKGAVPWHTTLPG